MRKVQHNYTDEFIKEKKKEKQYYCIAKTPLFSGADTDQIVEDIRNMTLFINITSKKSTSDEVRLFNIVRKTLIVYKKIWIMPAPMHAIVGARLRGEI